MPHSEHTASEVQGRIRELLATITELPPEEIPLEAHLVTELGADSFGAVEIMARLEAMFDIVIDPEDAVEMSSLQSITDLVLRLLGKARSDA